MKELSIEQKAQAYDEAISKIKEIITMDNTPTTPREIGEYLFSELKESEDEDEDEKIRKRIIHALHGDVLDMEETTEAIAWLEKQAFNVDNANKEYWRGYREGKQEIIDKYAELEKQGEQNLADKVELKFHEGEWIIRSAEGFKHNTYLVKEVKDYYACEDLKGQRVTFTLNDVHKNFKLWDISDAKPGDVLAVEPENGYHSPFIAIYKERGLDFFNSHCFVAFDGKFYVGENGHSTEDIHPATKEQRDTLEKTMADAGYTFDFEKKELKKIEQKPIEWHREDEQNLNACLGYIPDEFLRRWLTDAIHAKYDKPAECGEGNEKLFDKIGDLIHAAAFTNYETDENGKELGEYAKMMRLLKSLKDKVQPKVEWSKEDEAMLVSIISDFAAAHKSSIGQDKWLKSLKDRVQPKQEWGEEDEGFLNLLLAVFTNEHPNGIFSTGDIPVFKGNLVTSNRIIEWLKSLRPHEQWKPSEEQMKALNDLNLTGSISYVGQGQELINLYNDLKKLRR